jgi:hypothetical protein
MSIDPGELIDVLNYEPRTRGGYRRVDGFERFDGHDLASEAVYHILDFVVGAVEPTVGDTVTGGTSAATGYLLDFVVESGAWATSDATGYLVLLVTSGTFVSGEALNSIGTSSDDPYLRGADTDDLDSEYQAAAIEYTRDQISALPGSGATRGVWMYKGVVYAFRDNVAGTECVMYKATSTGWEVVTTPTLVAGGHYEFINFNFYGNAGSLKMYGVDGKNKGFEFDGTTFTQISTGMTTDTPIHVIAHKNHLFYAFAGGSIQHSSIGDPTTWSPILGASELAIGQECTGFVSVPGESLAIFGRNTKLILYGSSTADWTLSTYDDEAGAIEWSLQRFRYPMFLDDRGVTNLETSQSYGDFKANTFSQKVQSLITTLTPKLVASLRVREKDQYRLFFDDGRSLTFGFDGSKIIGTTVVNYGIPVLVTASVEDTSGKEVLLFGCSDGYVYKIDSGTSFDGKEVEAWLRPVFNHFGSPENKKRFFKAVLEIDADQPMDLTFIPEFGYGNSDLPSAVEGSVSVDGGGGMWGGLETFWRDFYWDAQLVSTAEGHIDGVGSNLSLFIRSVGTYEKPHTIHGVVIHYSIRGRNR